MVPSRAVPEIVGELVFAGGVFAVVVVVVVFDVVEDVVVARVEADPIATDEAKPIPTANASPNPCTSRQPVERRRPPLRGTRLILHLQIQRCKRRLPRSEQTHVHHDMNFTKDLPGLDAGVVSGFLS